MTGVQLLPFATPPSVARWKVTRRVAACFSSSAFGRPDSVLPLCPAISCDYRACFFWGGAVYPEGCLRTHSVVGLCLERFCSRSAALVDDSYNENTLVYRRPPMQTCARMRAETVAPLSSDDVSFGHHLFGAPPTAWWLRGGTEAQTRRQTPALAARCSSEVSPQGGLVEHRCRKNRGCGCPPSMQLCRHAVWDRAGAASAWPKRPPTNAETLPRVTQ